MAASGPRRPLLGLAACAGVGAIFGAAGETSAWVWIGSGLACLLGLATGTPRRQPMLLWLAFAFAMAAHARLHSPSAFLDRHGLLQSSSAESLEVEGRVASEPIALEPDENGLRRMGLALRTRQLRRLPEWECARWPLTVRLTLLPADPAPQFGDRLVLAGVLRRGRGGDLRMDTLAGGMTDHVSGMGNPAIRMALRARSWARNRLAMGLEDAPETRAVVNALALGYRSDLPEEQADLFAKSGTLHVFAVSGLHVGMVGVLLAFVLGLAGLPKSRWIWILGPSLGLFVMATGLKPSAVRALVMALAFWGAPALGRRPDAPSALGLALLAALLRSPRSIGDTGLQFSFVAVGGILVLTPWLLHPFQASLGVDPWIAEVSRLQRWTAAAKRWVATLAATSVAAWFVTAPLSAVVFHQVAPAALLTNLAVIPTAFVVLLTAAMSLASGRVGEAPVLIFNAANRVWVEVLTGAAAFGAWLPGGHVHLRPPGIPVVAAWMAGGLAWVVLRGRARVALATLAIATVAVGLTGADRPRQTEILALSGRSRLVGLVRIPAGGSVVILPDRIDAPEALVRSLQAQGVNRIRLVVAPRIDAPMQGVLDRLTRALGTFQVKSAVDFSEGESGWWPMGVSWDVAARDPDRGVLLLRIQAPGSGPVLVWTGGGSPAGPGSWSMDLAAEEVMLLAPPGEERPPLDLWRAIAPSRVFHPRSGRRDAEYHARRWEEDLEYVDATLHPMDSDRVAPMAGAPR